MANASALNYNCNNNAITAIWKLTRLMIQAGWVHKASAIGASKSTVTDLWATYATWIGSLTSGNWILLEGPNTLRIPFTTAPGAMRRGETIVQNVTGAQGELVSWVWDGVSLGYAVVQPMSGVFNTSDTIVGVISGQTFTPNGTIADFRRQVVIWLYNNAGTNFPTHQLHIYYQCCDSVAEATEQFSDATRMAAATATVCPGGAAAGANAFPSATSGSFVVLGQGGAGTVGNNVSPLTGSNQQVGLAQIFVANATPAAGVAADGSFILACGAPTLNPGAFVGFAFLRCDHGDAGDVEPYGWINMRTGSPTRLFSNGSTSNADQFGELTTGNGEAIARDCNQPNWRRRGMSAYGGDGGFVQCQIAQLAVPLGSTNESFQKVQHRNAGSADTVAPALTTIFNREPLWLIGTNVGGKTRKGQLRWLYTVEGGNGCDTYDNKQFVQLSNLNQPAIVGGFWDGVSVPTNA